jgi:hypothetical protein
MDEGAPGIVAEEVVVEDQAHRPEVAELFAGYEMSPVETEDVTLRWPTQLIVLAGAEGSGKTTMVAALYEQFGRGSFAALDFAGSRSLLAFEKLCHPNRVLSGAVRPTTERTIPSDEAAYYHLSLREANGERRRRHVLLSALSGELYRWARNSREECEKLTFLRRANVIVVLLDGEKLAVPETRVNAHADAAGILDAFLDAQMVSRGCQVEFVCSKLDRIRAGGDSALAFLKQTQQKLAKKFQARVPQLAFRELAARPSPSNDDKEFGERFATAFAAWTVVAAAIPSDSGGVPPPPRAAREFSKFGWRRANHGRGKS